MALRHSIYKWYQNNHLKLMASNDAATKQKIKEAEERERRFIKWYYKKVPTQYTLGETYVSPVGNMANFDGWFKTVSPDGTETKYLLEAKVRHVKYKARQMNDTFLTIKKFNSLSEWRKTMGCDRLLHLTFYIDALVVHDITPWAKGEKTFDIKLAKVRATEMDENGVLRDEDKYLMYHRDGHFIEYDETNTDNNKVRFTKLYMGKKEYLNYFK